jgi:hypothetical protein
LKKNFLILVLALAILAPKIGVIDAPVMVLFFTNFFLKSNGNFKDGLSRKYYIIIIIWLLLLVWSLSLFFINGSFNDVLILKPLRQIIMLTLVYSIFRRTNLEFTDICKIVITAALINTLVIYLQLYGQNVLGIQGFLMPNSFDMELDVSFRKPGLFSGYPHAGLLSLMAIICLLNFTKTMKTIYFVLIQTCLITSLILTSRTALLLSLLPFFVFFMRSFKSKGTLAKFWTFLVIGVWIIVSILSILPEDTTNVAFEVFKNYSETGSFKTSSQEGLNNSYVLPKHLTTYLFGNGLHNRTDLDTNVDDGYQSLVYGGGLLYLFTTLILFYIYSATTLRTLKNNLQRRTIYMIYFVVFIANYKADCMFSRVISDVLVLFLALSLNYKTEDNLDNSLKNKLENSFNFN